MGPGTWDGAVDFRGRELVLWSTDGPETTVIDAGETGRAVIIDGAPGEPVLQGFTVAGGAHAIGAGVYVKDSDPLLFDLTISGNQADVSNGSCSGTGLYLLDSVATVRHVFIEDNSLDCAASSGSHSVLGGMVYIEGGYPQLSAVAIRHNSCRVDATSLGRMELRGCALGLDDSGLAVLRNLLITDNSAVAVNKADVRAGIVFSKGTAVPQYRHVTIAHNTSRSSQRNQSIFAHDGAITLSLDSIDISFNELLPGGIETDVRATVAAFGDGNIGFLNSNLWDNDGGTCCVDREAVAGHELYDSGSSCGRWRYPLTTLNIPRDFNGPNEQAFFGEGGGEVNHWNVSLCGTNIVNHRSDPEYVDAASGDYHLADDSLIRDYGNRGLDDLDGSPSDPGAYGGPGAVDWGE